MEWSSKHQLWHRPGTDHLDMVYQARREWKILINDLRPDDRVLDIGAHIGGFSTMINLPQHSLWCIEPAPDTFELLQLNCPNATLINAALVNEGPREIPLYLSRNHTTSGSAAPSVVAFRGRSQITVKTMLWQDVLTLLEPTIIKCDCESTELFLNWFIIPKSVRLIGMELHYSRPEFKKLADIVLQTLTELGFKPVSGRYNTGNKYPSSNFVAQR